MKTEKINENSIKLTNSQGDSFVLYDIEGFYNDFFERDKDFKFSLQGVVGQSEQLKPKQQVCYKSDEPCKYSCSGLCKESC